MKSPHFCLNAFLSYRVKREVEVAPSNLKAPLGAESRPGLWEVSSDLPGLWGLPGGPGSLRRGAWDGVDVHGLECDPRISRAGSKT